ncbi:MAG: HAD hydrolase-like protein [Lysobacter sp.]|nr:HAD hydrolase-like protein [Lysobacter sp.]
MPRYRLAMFDFDGTLADSVDWFAATLREITPRYRLTPLDDAQLQALRGLDAGTIMKRLGLPWWKLPLVTREMRRRMRGDIAGIVPFDGIDTVLSSLKAQGVAIAIVTSNSPANVRAVLGERTMGHVDALEGDIPILGKKARLRKMLKRFDCAPHDAVYVGDEIRDAQAAAALGIDFIGVGWGYARPDALQPHASHEVCADSQSLLEAIVTR